MTPGPRHRIPRQRAARHREDQPVNAIETFRQSYEASAAAGNLIIGHAGGAGPSTRHRIVASAMPTGCGRASSALSARGRGRFALRAASNPGPRSRRHPGDHCRRQLPGDVRRRRPAPPRTRLGAAPGAQDMGRAPRRTRGAVAGWSGAVSRDPAGVDSPRSAQDRAAVGPAFGRRSRRARPRHGRRAR